MKNGIPHGTVSVVETTILQIHIKCGLLTLSATSTADLGKRCISATKDTNVQVPLESSCWCLGDSWAVVQQCAVNCRLCASRVYSCQERAQRNLLNGYSPRNLLNGDTLCSCAMHTVTSIKGHQVQDSCLCPLCLHFAAIIAGDYSIVYAALSAISAKCNIKDTQQSQQALF